VSGEAALLLRPDLGGAQPQLIVGHGRITGPAAKVLRDQWFNGAQRMHILHTVPSELEWFKELEPSSRPSTVGETREALERALVQTADLVAGVGPLLYREARDLARGASEPTPVIELLPGLAASPEVDEPPQSVRVLVLGRTADFDLKGLDIAARAVAALPEMAGAPRPTLVVRGSAPQSAVALRNRLVQAGGKPDIFVRDYADTEGPLSDDLARASALLLPSRTEGFGLVVLEAIAAGVPVLVSNRSGVGELLSGFREASSAVVPVTGDLDEDCAIWADHLGFILRDREAAFGRARALRTRLAQHLVWETAVRQIFTAIRADLGTEHDRNEQRARGRPS